MNSGLSLTCPAFECGGTIPVLYTKDGQNISPPLLIGGVSPAAKSLALVMEDPDAATDPHGPGRTFDHWLVYNIPPQTVSIAQDGVPAGAVVAANSAGQRAYYGPAPPTGVHRYYFWLYELREPVAVEPDIGKTQLLAAIKPHIIATAELVGLYGRPVDS